MLDEAVGNFTYLIFDGAPGAATIPAEHAPLRASLCHCCYRFCRWLLGFFLSVYCWSLLCTCDCLLSVNFADSLHTAIACREFGLLISLFLNEKNRQLNECCVYVCVCACACVV